MHYYLIIGLLRQFSLGNHVIGFNIKERNLLKITLPDVILRSIAITSSVTILLACDSYKFLQTSPKPLTEVFIGLNSHPPSETKREPLPLLSFDPLF